MHTDLAAQILQHDGMPPLFVGRTSILFVFSYVYRHTSHHHGPSSVTTNEHPAYFQGSYPSIMDEEPQP
jgi:hypothetical protein